MTETATPSQRYAAGVARGDWQDDPAQRAVLVELDRLHAALSQPPARTGALRRLFGGAGEPAPVPGLYLWGGVGRGKTFLIDLFADGLPLENLRAEGPADVPLPPGGRGGDRSQSERWGEGNSGPALPSSAPSGHLLPLAGEGPAPAGSDATPSSAPSGHLAPRPGPALDAGRSDVREPMAREPHTLTPLAGEGSAPAGPDASPSSAPSGHLLPLAGEGTGLPHADPRLGRKRRTHFHRFMRSVHEALREQEGERDPLAAIVRGWRTRGLRVLVLDEFFVTDIGDAMLLARLLDRMFAEGIVLVTTSNIEPAGLYRDGLQRARFLPAIALIEQYCHVREMVSDTDYRLRALTRSPVYRTPLDDGADAWLAERWHALGGSERHRDCGIVIDGRRIAVRGRDPGMAWFDFDAICEGPRGASDYIEVAREFHTVLVGGVPLLDGSRDDAARRFVTMVDEFYDRHVNLVCTAAAEPPLLYTGERLAMTFERTASRLIEMRSAEYLASEHRA